MIVKLNGAYLQMKMTRRSGRKFELMVGRTSIIRKNKRLKNLESGMETSAG